MEMRIIVTSQLTVSRSTRCILARSKGETRLILLADARRFAAAHPNRTVVYRLVEFGWPDRTL